MIFIKKIFSYSYGKNISDTLWKKRISWTEKQATTIENGSIVIDIGAGTGYLRRCFKHCHYIAHDFSKLDNLNYGEIDIVSDILKIPLPNEYADAVFCTEVFEHIPDPLGALDEIWRLLKPNGKLVFTAPLGSGQHQKPFHFYGGFTRFFYEKFFPEHGFEISFFESNGGIYGHLIEKLWRTNSDIYIKKGILKKIKRKIIQIFIYNIPTLYFDTMQKNNKDEDFTVGFHVIAIKRPK